MCDQLITSELTSVFNDELEKLVNMPSDLNPNEEMEHVSSLLTKLGDKLASYAQPRLEGIGGSGIVLSAVYQPFDTRRAIKLPRKRIYEAASSDDFPTEVDPELHALSKLSHPHITRLHDSYRLDEGNGHCMITEYVSEAKALHTYARILCCTEQCSRDRLQLEMALTTLAQIIYNIVDALAYMHEQSLLHFDIKPDNILVSHDGKPYVTDLGFARDIGKYKPDESVIVGFTWKYAHRTLRDVHGGARITQTAAKSKYTLTGEQLSPVYDVYSFGRTVQETLRVLEREYKDSIHSYYTYNYLHIVACLCLDTLNGANGPGVTRGDFVSDDALGMPAKLFSAHKFGGFDEVKVALERLLGLRRIENELPELDRWSAQTMNVSDIGIATVTPRVMSVVQHPAMQRLGDENQLGMLDTIFPTATHNRLQHSLGVYYAVSQYLTALYYDPENPTFRILFSESDGRRILLAALIHDVGQTTFGHEWEEVDKQEFSHGTMGALILNADKYRDRHNRTLREIIEGSGPECWNLALVDVQNLLDGTRSRPIDHVLSEILDGHLDADKLDYLVRDTQECRVHYGQGIDIERFLRSLTTCALSLGGKAELRLAIKRKGSASAEAVAFARYQLYQSLYWHHAFRATKAMFLTAASDAVSNLRKQHSPQQLLGVYPFRDAFMEVVMGVPSDEGEDRETRDDLLPQVLRKMLAQEARPKVRGMYVAEPSLEFLWKISEGRARTLTEDLMQRRYYKRVLEVPLGILDEGNLHQLLEMMRTNRLTTHNAVEEILRNTLESEVQSMSPERTTMKPDEVLQTIDRIFSERYGFLIDLPTRGWVSDNDAPIFVSDYKRRHFRADAGGKSATEPASLWIEHVWPMMKRIAFFRVFCEPSLHSIVTRLLSAEQILTAVAGEISPVRKALST